MTIDEASEFFSDRAPLRAKLACLRDVGLGYLRLGQPAITFERNGPSLKPEAERAARIAIGHPEGYQEAFAVLYAAAAEQIVARELKEPIDRLCLDYPNVEDGLHTGRTASQGVLFRQRSMAPKSTASSTMGFIK